MSRKRAKLKLSSSSSHGILLSGSENAEQLIPGLPDHVAHLILSKLPPSLLFSVCLPWRNLIYSPLFPPFLSLYTILTPSSPNPTCSNSSPTSQSIVFSSFDPISSRWQWLPKPPLDLLLRHPSFISRNLPIQSLTAAGRLVVVAATSEKLLPALNRPLVFDPVRPGWKFGPEVPVPRRWCAAGSVEGVVYVAGGVGTHFSADTARLVQRWDLTRGDGGAWERNALKDGVGWRGRVCMEGAVHYTRGQGAWESLKPLKNGKFVREAVDGVGWRGQLCMVNVDAKEGAVYDTRAEDWCEMRDGMVAGWRGPAAAMSEEVVYLVDPGNGVLRRYDEEGDTWVDVVECDRFKGARHVAAGGGRVCVVDGGGEGIVVVDVAAEPVRMWVVQPPEGYKAVAVHVLPRMSGSEFEMHAPGGVY